MWNESCMVTSVTPASLASTFRSEVGTSDLKPHRGIAGFLAAVLPAWRLPRIRTMFYRLAGFDIEAKVTMFGRIELRGPGRNWHKRLHIGKGSTLTTDIKIVLDGSCFIGENVCISPNVVIHTGTHAIGGPDRRCSPDAYGKDVHVGDGTWICMNAIILPGVRIGRGVVVGAGSVVASDVPDNCFVAGNPAIVKKSLPVAETE